MAAAILTLITTELDPTPGVFGFDAFLTPDGWPAYVAQHVQEEMTTPGVDGKRWRTVFDQRPPLAARCVAGVTDYATALTTASRLRGMVGRYASLSIVVGTVTVTLSVYIVAAPSIALPGPVVIAETGSLAAGVLCEFTFEIIDGTGVAGF